VFGAQRGAFSDQCQAIEIESEKKKLKEKKHKYEKKGCSSASLLISFVFWLISLTRTIWILNTKSWPTHR
jgi:hypothetical protein